MTLNFTRINPVNPASLDNPTARWALIQQSSFKSALLSINVASSVPP
jgi:hypothetical protein